MVICFTLRKKCPYPELFWFVFSRILTEYGELWIISPYSVRIRENTNQNNSEYGYFLCSVNFSRNKDYVHIIISRNSVHYISFASKFIWCHLYIYHLYHLFGIIYSEKYFHFYTWTSHWTAGSSTQAKVPHGSLLDLAVVWHIAFHFPQ